MKKVNFFYPLPEKILSKEKYTTWRINDEKNLQVGEIFLCTNNEPKGSSEYPGKGEFAKAQIIWIKETTFGDLTNEDLEGHEKFNSNDEMYKTFSGYYNMNVLPETRVKIIKFKLLE